MLNFEGQLLPVGDVGGVLSASENPSPRSLSLSAAKAVAMSASLFPMFSMWHRVLIYSRQELTNEAMLSPCSRIMSLNCWTSAAWSLPQRKPQPIRLPSSLRFSHEHASINAPHRAKAASIEMCSVRVADALFGIPISHILEIVGSTRPQIVPLAPGFVGGLVHYRGDVLTTVSLRHLLGLAPIDKPQDDPRS